MLDSIRNIEHLLFTLREYAIVAYLISSTAERKKKKKKDQDKTKQSEQKDGGGTLVYKKKKKILYILQWAPREEERSASLSLVYFFSLSLFSIYSQHNCTFCFQLR